MSLQSNHNDLTSLQTTYLASSALLETPSGVWNALLGFPITQLPTLALLVSTPGFSYKGSDDAPRASPTYDMADVVFGGAYDSPPSIPYPRYPNPGACGRWATKMFLDRGANPLDPCVAAGMAAAANCCLQGRPEYECIDAGLRATWACRNDNVRSECLRRCYAEVVPAVCWPACSACAIYAAVLPNCDRICRFVPALLYWDCMRSCVNAGGLAALGSCLACASCVTIAREHCQSGCR